ncbi:MAG: sugar ABC transporter permease [Candidatus Bathyarchaeia archaeon]
MTVRIGLSEKNVKYAFLIPCMIVLACLAIFPTIYSLYLTFCSWELSGAVQLWPVFNGGQNWVRLVQDTRFWSDLGTTLVFAAGAVSIEFIVGLGMAMLLNRQIPGRGILRVIFLIPMMATPVVVGYTFRMLFNMEHGPVNYFLSLIGAPALNWLGDSAVALPAMILADAWEWTPFMILVLLAGLQAIPQEPYEAALVDGAGPWQVFRYVTFPMLTPVMTVAVILRLVETLKIFDILYVVTAGGPGISTESLSLYVQIVGLTQMSLGYGSNVAYGLLVLVIIVATIFLNRMRRQKL